MAALFVSAALYHAAALALPAFARVAYPIAYSPLRHIVFIIVDLGAGFLFLRPPRWFIWPYLVLTVQILQGHGERAWRALVEMHQIRWIDGVVVFGALTGLALLVCDRLSAR